MCSAGCLVRTRTWSPTLLTGAAKSGRFPSKEGGTVYPPLPSNLRVFPPALSTTRVEASLLCLETSVFPRTSCSDDVFWLNAITPLTSHLNPTSFTFPYFNRSVPLLVSLSVPFTV